MPLTFTEAHSYTDGVCVCGDEEVVAPELDTTLDVFNVDFVLGADIRGMFVLKQTKSSPYVSFYMEVVRNGETTRYDEYAISGSSTKYYGFQYTLAAKEMADELTITFYGVKEDGTVCVGTPKTWSAKAGAVAKMESWYGDGNELNQKRCVLLANMLNYGAEAQRVFNYNYTPETLATYGLKAEYAALINTNAPEMSTWATTPDSGMHATLSAIDLNLCVDALRYRLRGRFCRRFRGSGCGFGV